MPVLPVRDVATALVLYQRLGFTTTGLRRTGRDRSGVRVPFVDTADCIALSIENIAELVGA